MSINFNDLCSNILPAGTYKVRVSDLKRKVSNNVATDDLIAHFSVIEGKFVKKTLIDTFYRNAYSFKLLPFLKAVGVDTGKKFDNLNDLLNYGMNYAKDKDLLVEVGVKTYNNNNYNEVKKYSPIPGSTTSAEEISKLFSNTENFSTEMKTETSTLVEAAQQTEPVVDFNMDNEIF